MLRIFYMAIVKATFVTLSAEIEVRDFYLC